MTVKQKESPAPLNSERVVREKQFHDQWAQTLRLDELWVRESFESPTAIENQYALSQMGDLKGKRLLDLGCGAGETSVYFALQGAQTFACDVSEKFLEVAQTLADKFNVRLNRTLADASRLPFPDNFFDIVFGNGILHHVDLLPAAREIQRVLKPSGKALFVEPLPYNPLINVYRHLAKGVRTADEKPLSFKQIRQLQPLFGSFHHEEFWLFSLLLFIHFFLIRRWHPSKVRYWKKVIEEGPTYQRPFSWLQRIDHFFLTYFPFLRPLCWNTVIVATK